MRSDHMRLALFGGFVIALVALRLIHLGADTPAAIGTGSMGVFVDEGYKTLDAKNRVLYGSTRWNAADGYTGWATQSPLGYGGFLAAFRLAEPALESARRVTVAWLLLLLATWVWAASPRLPPSQVILGLGLIGLQHVLFFFSRIALFELPICLLVYGTLWVRLRYPLSEAATAVLFLAASAIAAWGLKLSSVLYFVPLLGAVLVAHWQSARRPTRSHAAMAALSLVVPLSIAIFEPTALQGKLDVPGLAQLRQVVLNPLSFSCGALVAAGLLALAHSLRRDARALLADPYRAALALLAVTGPLLFAPFPYAPLRYHVPLLPAYALLALEAWRRSPDRAGSPPPRWVAALGVAVLAWGLVQLAHTLDRVVLRPFGILDPEARSLPGMRWSAVALPLAVVAAMWLWRRLDQPWIRSVSALLLALALILDVARIGRFVLAPHHEVARITHAIDEHLPEDASVAGDWAPLFTLDSGRPSLYLAAPDNAPERLLELRPDAFLWSQTIEGDRALDTLQTLDGVRLGPALYTSDYVGRSIVLYPLVYSEPER